MTSQEMADRFRSLKANLPDLVGDLVAENAPAIEDLQTAQLSEGLDSEGNRIEPDYTPFTVQIKKQKGQPYDRVTLRDTGDFHAGMFLSGGNNNQFAIGNSDGKAGALLRKYSDKILGLNEDSIQKLINEQLRPELPERALSELIK